MASVLLVWAVHVGAQPGPVMHLTMDDGSGSPVVIDATGNALNGTLFNMNGLEDWVPGVSGTALDFDGENDFVRVADDPLIDFGAEDFSVSFRVFKRAATADDDDVYGVGKWGTDLLPGANEWALEVGTATMIENSDRPAFAVEAGGAIHRITAPDALTLDTWHHLVGVRAGQSLRLYVDGALVAAAPLLPPGANVNDAGRDLTIAQGQSVVPATNAIFDDLQLYPFALADGNTMVGETAGADVAFLFGNAGQSVVQTTTTTTTTTTMSSSTTTTTAITASSTTTTTMTTVPLPVFDDIPLSGQKLLLKDKPDKTTKRRLKLVVKDPGLTLGAGLGSADDPTQGGAELRVRSAAPGGFEGTYALPASGWRALKKKKPEKGWKFDGSDAITKVILKAGKQLVVKGKGSALVHTLAADPESVDVILIVGTRRYCMRFGGQVTFKEGKSWVAKNAVAPGACPSD